MNQLKNSQWNRFKLFILQPKRWWVYLVCFLFLLTPITIYRLRFGRLIIDNNPSDFGTYGDFLNPFIGLINIILLLYLTFEVKRLENNRENEKQEWEDKRSKELQEFEQNRTNELAQAENKRLDKSLDVQLRIAMNRMRNEKASDIAKIFDSLTIVFKTEDEETVHFQQVLSHQFQEIATLFHFFVDHNQYLFEDILNTDECKKNIENLKKTIDDLITTIAYHIKYIGEHKIYLKTYNDKKLEQETGIANNIVWGVEYKESVLLTQEIKDLELLVVDLNKKMATSQQQQQLLLNIYSEQKTNFMNHINKYIIDEMKRKN
jgi:hypothetical protein